MKTEAIIVCIFANIFIASAGPAIIMEQMEKAAEGCAKKTGISDEEIMGIMKNHGKASSHTGFCFMACVKKEIGIMNEDNTLNIEKMKEMGEPLKAENPEMYEKALQMATHCTEEVSKAGPKDECEASELMFKCCAETSAKHGIKGIPFFD